jgi:hypothetical protein
MVPAQQVAPLIVAQAARGGDASRLIVQLRPAELGAVEVAVEGQRDGTTRLSILVERPETLMLLARDRGAIEQALQAAGIEPDSATLSLGLGQPGQGGAEGRGGGARDARRADGHGTAPGGPAADPILPTPPRRLARGLLDVAF